MVRRVLILFCLSFVAGPARAGADVSPPDNNDQRQGETTSAEEWEAKGIIPAGGIVKSTQPITPVTVLPQKKPYDAALEELAMARDLWEKGQAEAASDVALEAYDDLLAVSMPRKLKKQRRELLANRHEAATLYIESSLAYIQDFVNRAGRTPAVMEEGRSRLRDLRDVAVNYWELTTQLNKTIKQFTVETSTPTAR
jgi:hypothetical protein